MALKNMPGSDPLQRMGRPGEILLVVDHGPDGSPITAGQKVITQARLGLDSQTVADSAGVDRVAVHKWRVKGARLRATQAQGKRKLTPEDMVYVHFVNDLESAEATWEANLVALITKVGEGGLEQRKVSEKWERGEDGEMFLAERTVVIEHTLPQWTAMMTMLERRKPERWARRTYSELTGANGTPLVPPDDQARTLADEARAYLTGTEDGAKQAKGTKP
jgi:hypothetical protein